MIEDDARHELSNTTSARSDYSRREFLGLAGAGSALSLVIGSAAGGNAPSPPNSGGKINVPALDQNLKAEFEEYGFVVLKEAIPRRDALNIEERVKEIMSRRPDADKIDQHLPELLNYLDPKDDAAFLPLVTQPVCLALAQALLGEGFQMSEVGCRWRKPGAPAGPMHVSRPIESFNRDGLPLPNVCFVLAYSWMLSDLTADMGATLYLPFSHHSPRGPRPNVKYSYAVPIEAPAGSVLVHHSALWHHFGPNTTRDKPRVGVMSGYFPGWLDPVSVGWKPLKQSVRDRMPEVIRKMNKHVTPG